MQCLQSRDTKAHSRRKINCPLDWDIQKGNTQSSYKQMTLGWLAPGAERTPVGTWVAPARSSPSFTSRLIRTALLLSNSEQIPTPCVLLAHICSLSSCVSEEGTSLESTASLSPILVKPTTDWQPVKTTLQQLALLLLATHSLQKPLAYLLAWSKADPEQHSSTWSWRYFHHSHQGNRCPLPGSLHQPKERGSILNAHQRRNRTDLSS